MLSLNLQTSFIKGEMMELLSRTQKKQAGFLSVDFMVVLALVLVTSAYFMSKSDASAAKSDEQLLVDEIGTIIEGSRAAARTQEDRFESLTIEFLSERRLVPEKWGDGSTANPHGGAYDLGDSTVTELVINASGLNTDLCTRGAEVINKNFSATCSGDTLTVTAS